MLNRLMKLVQKFVKITIFSMVFLVSFSPLAIYASDEPFVATEAPTNIDDDSATLHGYVDGNDLSTRAWFEYGRTTSMTSTTSKTSTGSDRENFSKKISNLREDTLYYFRAVAENSKGKVYGNTFSLRTNGDYDYNNYYDDYYSQSNCQNYYYDYGVFPSNDCYQYNYNQNSNQNRNVAPVATTNPASDVGNQSAQLNSLILNNSNSEALAWFEWGTTPSLGNRTATITTSTSPSVNHANILTGLNSGTIYYFRAVAENSYFRNNGIVLSFATGGTPQPQYVYTPDPTPPAPTIIYVPTPVEPKTDTKKEESKESSSNEITANAVGVFAFFPGNVIGWLILIILVLMLMLLMKHPAINIFEKKHRSNQADHTPEH